VARERERHREAEDEIEPRANGFRRARDGRHDGKRQELQQKARQHRVIAADRILIAEGFDRQPHRKRHVAENGSPSC
jgi:hypothetical protein